MVLRRSINDIEIPIENKRFNFNDLSCQEYDDNFVICEAACEFGKNIGMEDTIRYRVSIKLGILVENHERVRYLIGEKIKDPYLRSFLFLPHISIEELERIIKGEVDNIGRGRKFKTIEMGETKYSDIIRANGVKKGDIDIIAQDVEKGTIYVIDCTISAIKAHEKIDTIANIANKLLEKGIHAEPIVFVSETATMTKNNLRGVKVIDRDDLVKILDFLRRNSPNRARELIIGK